MPTPPIEKGPEPAAPEIKGERIAKLLARAGVASRREIERMIDERRIALDGQPLDTPATILPSLRGITVDGQPVAAPEATRLFVYHKPPGLLVTERDPAGRATIYDRLPTDLPRTVPVGRLDLSTEGLLLLTTDGGLKRQLELPATGVERTYRARAYGEITQARLEELIEGVEIDGIRYGGIDANLERRTGANVWIEMTLTEGKNREVRRVLEYLGLEVSRLIRTRYGPFILGDLPPGDVGEVRHHDLAAFVRTLDGNRRSKGADLQTPVTVESRARPTTTPAAHRGAPAPAGRGPGAARHADEARRPDTREPRRDGYSPRGTSDAGAATRRPVPQGGAIGRRESWPDRPAPAPRAGDRFSPAPGRAAPARPAHSGSDQRRDTPGGGRSESARSAASDRAPPSARNGDFARQADRTATPARPPRAASDPRRDAPGAGRSDRPRFGSDRFPSAGRSGGSSQPASGRPASARPSRTLSDPRRDASGDRPDWTRSTGSDRASPSASGPARGRGPVADRSKGPGKGPSGGRGHPPRGPKGKPGRKG